jgi:hypothetical protein
MSFKDFLLEDNEVLVEQQEIEQYFGITLLEEVAKYVPKDVVHEIKIKGVTFKILKAGDKKYVIVANDQYIDDKTFSDEKEAIKNLKLMKNFNGSMKESEESLDEAPGAIVNPHGLARRMSDMKEIGKYTMIATDRSKRDAVIAVFENPQGGYWHISIEKSDWDGK